MKAKKVAALVLWLAFLGLILLQATEDQRIAQNAALRAQANALRVEMVKAIRADDHDTVALLLKKGAPASRHYVGPLRGNRRGNHDDFSDPLRLAARVGSVKIMSVLVEHGATVNPEITKPTDDGPCRKKERLWRRSDFSRYPLDLAAGNGHLEAVTWLLDKGAQLNINGPRLTALQVAASQGHDQIVLLLLERGADSAGAVRTATRAGRVSTVRLLLEHGAEVGELGYSLHEGIRADEAGVELTALLIAHGIDVNDLNGVDWPLLHAAARFGGTKVVELLLQNGADVNLRAKFGDTALDSASRLDDGPTRDRVLQLLLSRGANPELARYKSTRWYCSALKDVKP